MSLNYGEEVKKIEEYEESSGNWFRPEAGRYNIIMLAEPEIIPKEFEKDGVKETVEQARLRIEVDKSQYTWDVGIGKTKNSIYGQLMLIGESRGKLVGEKMTLLVKRSNDRNEYTIVEAIALMKPKGEREKKIAEDTIQPLFETPKAGGML